LSSARDILEKARKGEYAVPAFECFNMESIEAAIEAADELKSPVIIQAYRDELEFVGIDVFASLCRTVACTTSVPVVLHLDHTRDIKLIMKALRAGFNSVMVDASDLSLEENIRITKEVTRLAHPIGVAVESMLGVVGKAKDGRAEGGVAVVLTDQKQVVRFVEETDIDVLAPSIGTISGLTKEEPKIDFDLLKTISKITDIPLALHGGSGVPDKYIKKLIKYGISKLEIGTAFYNQYYESIKKLGLEQKELSPRKIMGTIKEDLKTLAKTKIILCGSSGKA
jgi:fructose-bisphosphate aldolase class II